MARSAKRAPQAENEPVVFAQTARQSLENTPMRRHTNPIPQAAQSTYAHDNTEAFSAVLAALEQQNNLLVELLGAVTGLTAACLCRNQNS